MIDDERLRRLLDADVVPEPPADRTGRTLCAAAPLLAVHARRASIRSVVRPVVVALLPLPLIVGIDVALVFALHAVLASVLPGAVSAFVAVHYALLLGLLLTLTYAAVPLLVDRQLRAGLETAP